MSTRVGLVGGCGAVGRMVAEQLRDWRIGPLLMGCRDLARAERLASAVRADAAAVDADDPNSLARFCRRCAVVVDCCGPAYRIGDRVRLAARAAGAHYVGPADVPGPPASEHRDLLRAGRVAVVAAGVLPGLSGLLPRFLARHVPATGASLSAYVGGRDGFTPAGAADYLAGGGGFGIAGAALVDGRVVTGVRSLPDLELAHFPEPVSAHPYLSAETRRLAADLGLASVRWYHVFAGRHVPAALHRLAGTLSGRRPVAAAAHLCRAGELDLFGRERFHRLVLELRRGATARALVLTGTGATALTAAASAVAVRMVAGNHVPAGLHYAAEVLDPVVAVDLLAGARAVTGLRTFADATQPADEGVL
jgi:hypothetical protein